MTTRNKANSWFCL
uniref:Uncharacterized protein n=1 Tax=Moniliophthora roreri TaxID=221103 RepID=A0A0W0G3K3_MONRR